MSGRRSPRGLNPADRALWGEITKSIKPLRERQTELPADEAAVDAPHEYTRPLEPRRPQPASKISPPLAGLDRRTRARVARGRVAIDARIDLHGLTLERARARLSAFLLSAQGTGASLVLVITGKGGTASGGRGALRREVPQWLSLPAFRPLVIGFEEAAAAHGGAGALYVRVRRSRS
jgi:DNA-nicking Smr family endonuclease